MEKKMKTGDVYKLYYPGIETHCRDNVLVCRWDNNAKNHYLVDTFWGSGGRGFEAGYFDPENLTFLFNLKEVNMVKDYEWEDYQKEDRFVLHSHHGYRPSYYVKKGAKSSINMKIENAREKVYEKRKELDSAVSSYEWSVRELARLEEKASNNQTP